MNRPLRLKSSSALYHVTSPGDRREAIHEDGIPHAQGRSPAPPRADFVGREIGDAAMAAAGATGNYRYQRIAKVLCVHFTMVERVLPARAVRTGESWPGLMQ